MIYGQMKCDLMKFPMKFLILVEHYDELEVETTVAAAEDLQQDYEEICVQMSCVPSFLEVEWDEQMKWMKH